VISVGGIYTFTADVIDGTGALANAATFTLTITLPDGTTLTPAVANPPAVTPPWRYAYQVTGRYRYEYVTTMAGRHTVHAVTTDPVRTFDDEFDVAAVPTAAIVSLADAKAQLNIDAADTGDDDELRNYIIALTGVVEQHLHEVVVPRQFTDDPQPMFRARRFRVWNAPLLSLVSVATWDGSQTWDVTQMHPSPSGLVKVMAGPPLTGEIVPVYMAGRNPIPPKYKQGGLVILQHVWESQRGQGGVMSGVIGEEEYRREPGTWFTIPNKALEYLGPPRPVVA
jgi:hypothetical protein